VNAAIAEILALNVLMLVMGTGLLPVFGIARTPATLVRALPLAYAVGFAVSGVAVATLVVLHIPIGWPTMGILAVVALVAGWRRLENGGGFELRLRRPSASLAAGWALLAITIAFIFREGVLLAVKPILETDGWWIWGTRARALYDFGHPLAPVFTDPQYPALQHPLLLPALEALESHAIGRWDGTLIHLQLLGFVIAFVGGAWTLLRHEASPVLVGAVLLATVTAPSVLSQLETNDADIPVAAFIALGVMCLALWLRGAGGNRLALAGLFLAAGALTKNEGEMFAFAALIATAILAGRARLRPLAYAAAAVVVADLPWRIWIATHHVKIAEYSLSDLVDPHYLSSHFDRVGPSASELLDQIFAGHAWSYLVWASCAGVLGAVLAGRLGSAAFAVLFLVLGFAGLLAIYWISTNPVSSHLTNSSNRTIDSLVLSAALLVPLLLSGPVARIRVARGEDAAHDPSNLPAHG
jgi:hypothetical protein